MAKFSTEKIKRVKIIGGVGLGGGCSGVPSHSTLSKIYAELLSIFGPQVQRSPEPSLIDQC